MGGGKPPVGVKNIVNLKALRWQYRRQLHYHSFIYIASSGPEYVSLTQEDMFSPKTCNKNEQN